MVSTQQELNIERVSNKIRVAILDFCTRLGVGKKFTADDLRRFVAARVPSTAPGSPDRILRDLRQQRQIDYEVVSRSGSIYRLTEVRRV